MGEGAAVHVEGILLLGGVAAAVLVSVASSLWVWFDNCRTAARQLMTPREYERLNQQRQEER